MKSVIKASLLDGNIEIITPKDTDNIRYKLDVNFDELYFKAYDEFFKDDLNNNRNSSTLHEAFNILEVIEAVRLSSSIGQKLPYQCG